MTEMAHLEEAQCCDASSDTPDQCGSCLSLVGSRPYLLLVLCVIATVALYVPHLATVFIDWDLVAYRYVMYTTDYWDTAVRLFTDFQGKVVAGYYAPVAGISLMLDKWFVGATEPSPWFTLLVNLLVHCLNGVLVFILLRAIGASPYVAILAAAIFLIHPLQVSSVLWFPQRKGLLATALYLLASLGYIRYTERGALGPYIWSLILFAAALLTKPTVVVLPLTLLAWQVLVAVRQDPPVSGQGPRIIAFMRSALPLVPFFLVALVSGLAAMQSEGVSMDVEGPPDMPIQDRPFIAAAAIWFYVGRAVAPLGLTPIYPRWDVDIHQAVWWLPLLGLLGVFALLTRYRNVIGTIPFWCLASFLIPLLPAIGLMKFGYLRLSYVADHFMYLPMVGMAGLLAFSIVALLSHVRAWAMPVLCVLTVTYLSFLAFQTWSYGSAWKDSVTFWSYNLNHNPWSWASHTYLGHALVAAGRPAESIPHFEQTIALKRAYISDRRDRGLRLERAGRQSEATLYVTQAENLEKTLAIGYHNLGNALLHSNRHAQAREQYKTALHLQPKLVKALTNLGVCHIVLGSFPEAVQELTKAAELDANNFEAQYNLGYALRVLGDRATSDRHFAKARSLKPHVPLPEFPDEQSRAPRNPQ
jgi:protein O-mannosyl-transferase